MKRIDLMKEYLLVLLIVLSEVVVVQCFSSGGRYQIQQKAFALRSYDSSSTKLALFNFGGAAGSANIPKSTSDRDTQAIDGIIAAIESPRNPSMPLIECEFPALQALNKLGDGSLRSAREAEQANLEFVTKLVTKLAPPAPFLPGPKISLLVSASASKSFLSSIKSKLDKGGKATVYSLKDGIPTLDNTNNKSSKDSICILVTPSSRSDYQTAVKLANQNSNGNSVIIINGFAKDVKSVPGSATMGFFLKPLTYNSTVVGFLIRKYPGSWTVLDAKTNDTLGTFTDDEILFGKSNTPDLRTSVRLVQKAVDERAIRERQG